MRLPNATGLANRCGNINGMAGNTIGSPATHFGRQLRKERLARGWSVHEFARRSGISVGHVSRIENGKRPPTLAVATTCDDVFPERRGWFTEYYEESRDWMPAGFRSWGEYEDSTVTLRAWSPVMIHGLLQTQAYTRALLMTARGVTSEIIAARLANRMERQQRILYRDDPPDAWFVIDELSLYRRVGSAEVMAAQCAHLAEVAQLPHVTMQILPAVEHPAGASELIVTDSAAYVEHMISGAVYTDEQTVSTLSGMFHTILAECYRASESRARLERMTDIWTGGNRAIAKPTEGHASKRPPANA